MKRKIVHIDMDCFYAAVELRDRPDLKNRPVAVGGDPRGRGIVATCNYVARRFGVHSALSSREAVRRCPDLILLPTRFSKYRQVSQEIKKIFQKYSPLVEPISLDEAYIDLTDNQLFDGNATKTARAIRQEIYHSQKLTASAGIAPNKFLAKVASEWNKPNGQKTITPAEIEKFMISLQLKKIPGVGKATLSKLHKMGYESCGDLQRLSLNDMSFHFGRFGERLYDLCRGVDHSKVRPSRQRKSISVENTFRNDLSDWRDIKKQVKKLFEELSFRIKKANLDENQIRSLVVKFKSSEFEISSREKALPLSQESFLMLAEQHFLARNESIRLLGLGCRLASKNKTKKQRQLPLFQTI